MILRMDGRTENPEDICPSCHKDKLVVIEVDTSTIDGQIDSYWVVECKACGHQETRDDLT